MNPRAWKSTQIQRAVLLLSDVADLLLPSLWTAGLRSVHKNCHHCGYFSESFIHLRDISICTTAGCGAGAEVVILLALTIRWPPPASLVLPHPVERVKAAGSAISIKMLLLSSALKWSWRLQSLTTEVFQAILATTITSKKQCLTVPRLWLLQVVLLYRNDLEYSGCFISLICVNQDTLPRL